MADDIVLRLRSNLVSREYQLEAADCIEWLRGQMRNGDDLPKRLRELERDLIQRKDLSDCHWLPAIGEAADEIDRLRELISRMEVRRG